MTATETEADLQTEITAAYQAEVDACPCCKDEPCIRCISRLIRIAQAKGNIDEVRALNQLVNA
jgi:hypothetical protein